MSNLQNPLTSVNLLGTTAAPGENLNFTRADGSVERIQVVSSSTPSVTAFGAVADAKIFKGTGTTQAGQQNFRDSTSPFTAADIGKVVLIAGAGAGGTTDYAGTVQKVLASGTAQLSPAVPFALASATWAYGTDNTTALKNALAAVSGTGATLIVPQGQYMFGAGGIDFSLLNNLTLSGYGATFIVAFPGTGNNFFAGGAVVGPALSLASNVAQFSRTIPLTGAPLPANYSGQIELVSVSEVGSIYTVTSVSGASPQTITVDRAILFPYASANSNVQQVIGTPPSRIFIQGLTFTGACEQYIKIRGVINCFIRDCNFLSTVAFASVNAFFLSLFSFNWSADNIIVNGPNGAGMGSCEQCWVTRYTYTFAATPATYAASNGFQILNSANCGLSEFEINGAQANGVQIDQLAAPGVPFDVGCTVANGAINSCTLNGVLDNGFYSMVDTVLITGCGQSGIVQSSQSENSKARGNRILNCGSCGIIANSGIATGTASSITDCLIQNNTAEPSFNTSGIAIEGPMVFVTGCTVVGVTGVNSKNCIVVSDQGFTFGCRVVIDNCDLVVPGTSLGAALVVETNNPDVTVSNTRVRGTGGAAVSTSGLNLLNGKMRLDNVQCTMAAGTAGFTGVATSAGTLLRINEGVDLDGCTTPLTLGGFCNRSINGSANANSITLNGTTAVNYSFTDTKSTERVDLILRTRGATPGNGAVLVAVTAGTGVSLAGNAAGVNDVYDLVIG